MDGWEFKRLFYHPFCKNEIHKHGRHVCLQQPTSHILYPWSFSGTCRFTWFWREAIARRFSTKKIEKSLRKNSEKKQENICAKVSSLLKQEALSLQPYYKEIEAQVFSQKVWEIFKNIYFEKHLRMAASSSTFGVDIFQLVLCKKCWNPWKLRICKRISRNKFHFHQCLYKM